MARTKKWTKAADLVTDDDTGEVCVRLPDSQVSTLTPPIAVELKAGMGAALACTVAATNYQATVTAGKRYRVRSIAGAIRIGWAAVYSGGVPVAAATLDVIPSGGFADLLVPAGVTRLNYGGAAGGESGNISQIED